VHRLRGFTRWTLLLLGSQAFLLGLAPVVSAGIAVDRGALKASRTPGEAARLAPSPAGRDVAARRVALRKAVPDRFGPQRQTPWITKGKPPLVSALGGKLQRTTAFTGVPDTVRMLGIRIDFETDRLGTQTTTPDGKFDYRDGKALGIVIDPPPHNRSYFMSHLEAMSRYWREQSYGNLVVEYDVYPQAENAAYRLGDTGDYGPWTLGQASYDEAQRFFRESVIAADQTDSIPFGEFDAVVVFHAGSDFQADILGDSQRDFPTFQIGLVDSVPVNGGALGVHGGMVMPETENQDGYYGALNGTMSHEFGHIMGLPDLYDIYTFFPAVGVWSNMDSGYLLGTLVQDAKTGNIVEASGILPVSLDPWCKTALWPDGLEIVDPGTSLSTSLRATQLTSRLLKVPLGSDEYLLVENRQLDLNGDNTIYLDRDSTTQVILGPGLSGEDSTDTVGDKEFDFLLPNGGILVWHVDETVICTPIDNVTYLCGPNANPDAGINSNPDRMGVRLLEADGIRDIGDPNSFYFFGGPFDPYFVGNHTVVTDDTNPSARTNDGARSHVRLEVGSPQAVDMDIAITSEWRLAGWPVHAGVALTGSAPTYGSMRHDGRRSVVTAADSLIYAWMADGTPYYTDRFDGEWAAVPSKIRFPVLFADSLFLSNVNAPTHGAGIVATGMDGNVYAYRPALRDDVTSIPLVGWPPVLDVNAPTASATTPPVLAPSGAVLVGASDGRLFVITPSDSATVGPRVTSVSDTLVTGSGTDTSPVTGHLAVGRFLGAGGYQVAYSLESGILRVVEQTTKDPGRFETHWTAGGPGFRPHLLGVDLDRAADRNLEIIVADPDTKRIHAFDLEGNDLPGWPVTVAAGFEGPPVAGDLDGDGFPEVILLDREGNAHRWGRNGVELQGWPVALPSRHGASAVGGAGSPVIGDIDQDGRPEALFALDNGILAALEPDGTGVPGWPISVPGAADDTPLLLTLNGTGFAPDPAGPAWLHLVAGGGFDGSLGAYQLPARADSALTKGDGVSSRTPWQGYGGNRRRSSVLEDVHLVTAVTASSSLAPGSVYCFPNPVRGDEIGVAYTLGAGVSEVVIRVLDPTGKEVDRVAAPAGPTQNVAKILLRGWSSGVYVVRVEARGSGGTDVAFQKFAIVR
jgi:M6 family metalloprotease-like protein